MSETVPVTDLAPLFDEKERGKEIRVAAAIDEACRRWSFFLVVHHPIPATLVNLAWAESRRWNDGLWHHPELIAAAN